MFGEQGIEDLQKLLVHAMYITNNYNTSIFIVYEKIRLYTKGVHEIHLKGTREL